MSARFDAILFDNDGVLVDTEGHYLQANREVLARVGVALTEADYRELFLHSSRGAWHLAEARGVAAAEIASLRAARDARFEELIAAGDVLMPHARQVIGAAAMQHRLAIVTSSKPRPFALAHARTGLLPHFELVLTRDKYVHSKPDPEPYRTAAALMGVDPARCLVIEDSERGLAAAKAAGMTCWIVPSLLTRGSAFAGADAVLADLEEVGRLLG